MPRYRLRTLLDWFSGGATTGENPYAASMLRAEGYCSFCGKSYRDVGPLAEGPSEVYICRRCVQRCGELIDDELTRLKQNKPRG
jgi:ATP-dependent Clp protease ATP-binding subunit ClpX